MRLRVLVSRYGAFVSLYMIKLGMIDVLVGINAAPSVSLKGLRQNMETDFQVT